MNVGASATGAACWIDRTGQIVSDPKNAFPYGLIKTNDAGKYIIRDSHGYFLYMNNPVLQGSAGWSYGINNGSENDPNTGITAFTLSNYSNSSTVKDHDGNETMLKYQGTAYSLLNGRGGGITDKHWFNLDRESSPVVITAADHQTAWNDWYLISRAQMDEWNRFSTAYNNAKNILNVPLKPELYTRLTTLLGQCSSATYSDCVDSNADGADADGIYNLSKNLEDAYADAVKYLKGYALDGATANAEGEGTWHHDFIPYDMNDQYNGLLANDGTSIAASKGIANPSFDNGTTGWGNLTNVNGVVSNKLKLWIGDGNGYDSTSENYPNFAPTGGFSFDQTIANVPSGYYIVSAKVSTA